MRRSPRGEFTHERTCRVSRAQFNRTHTGGLACRNLVFRVALYLRQRRARVHRNGYGRNRVVDFTKVHTDNACNVVVNDDTSRAHLHRNFHFLLEGSVTTFYNRDSVQVVAVRIHKQASYRRTVVRRVPNAGHEHVFERRLAVALIHIVHEIVRVAVDVAGFFIEYNRFTVGVSNVRSYVRRLLTVDTCNGECRRKGGRRTYRTRVGVGCKVRTVNAAVARAIIVARRADQANPLVLDTFVYAIEHFPFIVAVVRRREAARGTE